MSEYEGSPPMFHAPSGPSSLVPTVQKSTQFTQLRPDSENEERFYSRSVTLSYVVWKGAAAQSQGRGQGAEGLDVL